MKKMTYAVTFSAFVTLTLNVQALELTVVKDYNGAAEEKIWKKAKVDQVPSILLSNEVIAAPTHSYANVFPKSFLQEALFTVCYRNCDDNDIFKIKDGEMDSKSRSQTDVIEQSTVYYWLSRYYRFLENKLSFNPHQYLKVMTNRLLKDEIKGKTMKNNAFFNPADVTLSFLPANNNLLFKLLGERINRSGFDPSVVAHEASHYLFHHLFPSPVNEEIGGLNEGFADYIANIFLDNPKVGLVMLHGKALRDSDSHKDSSGKEKIYEPGLEVHDLGERVAFALWQARKASMNQTEMDKLVLDAISELNNNPYSTIHDFKVKMLARLPFVMDEVNLSKTTVLWDVIFPGEPAKILSLDFLNLETPSAPKLGFKRTQILPEKLAKEYGVPARDESSFDVHQLIEIEKGQVALQVSTDEVHNIPHWMAIDETSGNVLGIFDSSKKLMKDPSEISSILPLANIAKTIPSITKDYTKKLNTFAAFSEGQGNFSALYKIKNKTVTKENFSFNGNSHAGHRIHMDVKRKLLTGTLFGMPDVDSIDLYTIANGPSLKTLPQLNNETVIGYQVKYRTGTTSDIILYKHNK